MRPSKDPISLPQPANLSATEAGVADSRPALVLIAAMMGVIVVTLDVSVVNVALEALRSSFSVRIEGLQWVLNVYTLAYATFLISAGAMGDRIGARATFLLGFVIFTLCSVACGLAPSFTVLLTARTLQGVGAALLVPSAMALLQRAYPNARDRAKAIGLWAGAGSFALAGGPVIGGALIASFGWRSIFLINLPVGLLGIWLTLRYAPRPRRTTQRSLDLPGQIAAAASLASLTAAVTQAGSFGWTNPWILGGLIAAVILGAAFLAIESGSRHPMMPLDLFRGPGFSAATFVGFVANFAFYGLVFVLSLFFQTIQGKSTLETGLAFVPMTAILMLINVGAGRLNNRFGARPVMVAGLVLASAGYLAMLPIQADSSMAALIPAFMASGIGIALTIPSLMTVALAVTDPGRVGIAGGVLNSARQVGGAIGVALFGSIIGSAGPAGFVHGMHLSATVAGAALLAGAAATLAFVPSARAADAAALDTVTADSVI
jgi:DHA2 family methylenomycin A resistance protein-like MFS transporter